MADAAKTLNTKITEPALLNHFTRSTKANPRSSQGAGYFKKRLFSIAVASIPPYYWGGTVNNVGNEGNFWSGTSSDTSNARNLNANAGNLNPQNSNNKGNGFTVRCVAQ